MRVLSICTYPSSAYRSFGGKNIAQQEREIVEAAERELEIIKEQGKQAGTDSAWWRAGFGEAKQVLESIVISGHLPEVKESRLMSFHDYDDDGFI